MLYQPKKWSQRLSEAGPENEQATHVLELFWSTSTAPQVPEESPTASLHSTELTALHTLASTLRAEATALRAEAAALRMAAVAMRREATTLRVRSRDSRLAAREMAGLQENRLRDRLRPPPEPPTAARPTEPGRQEELELAC